MAQISYNVSVLEAGRAFHDFEISCPHCSERAIAVLDGKDKRIVGFRKGMIEGNGKKNVVQCNTCSCMFKVRPKVESEINHISRMLADIKYPRWVSIEHYDNAILGHLHKKTKPKKPAKKATKKPKNVKLKKALDKFHR